MSKVRALMKLVQACCARVRTAIDPEGKRAPGATGEDGRRRSDESQGGSSVVQATFPKSDY